MESTHEHSEFEKDNKNLIPTENIFYQEAISRNIGLLTRADQERLRNSKIAIPGMGGVGGLHLINLIRLGITNFSIADFDTFEIANFNRQYGAKVSNLYQSKVNSMVKEAKEINPYVNLQVFQCAITEENVDEFLKDVDVVIDSIDFFELKARRLVFNKAHEKGIYIVCAGPIGYSAAMLIFSPTKMNFDTYFDIHNKMSEKEMVYRFAVGLCPSSTQRHYMDMNRVSFENRKGPSLNLSCQLCTAAASTEVIRILLQPHKVKAAPHYFQYDLWRAKFVKGNLLFGNKNPLQKLKIQFLKQKLKSNEATLSNALIAKNKKVSNEASDLIMQKILSAAILAPSAENGQPWKFNITTSEIDLYLDKNKAYFNVAEITALISCGAAIENMAIAASHQNITVSVIINEALNYTETLGKVAIIKLEKTAFISPDNLYSFIKERHTNRTKFNGKAIPAKDLQKLKNSISNNENVTLQLITDKDQKKLIANLAYEADLIRTENEELHNYFIKMIRFNDEKAIETRDGFHLKNLEAGIEGELFLKFIKPWKRMNVLNKLGINKLFANVSKVAFIQSSAVGIIKIKGTGISDFILAGRAFQRVWLTATSLGIDFQPMGAVALFWMNFKYGKNDIFSPKHKKDLESLWIKYEHLFNENKSHFPVMLFRLGYGKYVKVKTLRKEISDFLI